MCRRPQLLAAIFSYFFLSDTHTWMYTFPLTESKYNVDVINEGLQTFSQTNHCDLHSDFFLAKQKRDL